jgi:hypothetical protein
MLQFVDCFRQELKLYCDIWSFKEGDDDDDDDDILFSRFWRHDNSSLDVNCLEKRTASFFSPENSLNVCNCGGFTRPTPQLSV